ASGVSTRSCDRGARWPGSRRLCRCRPHDRPTAARTVICMSGMERCATKLAMPAAIILIVSVGCAGWGDEAHKSARARVLVSQLDDPAHRDVAGCELLRLGLFHSSAPYKEVCERVGGAVNHVIVAPQRSGPPMRIVFRNPGPLDENAGRGRAKGPFTLFDSDGY